MNKKHFKWLTNTQKGAGVNQNCLTVFYELALNFRTDFLMYVRGQSL
jgi:hypothetical protein